VREGQRGALKDSQDDGRMMVNGAEIRRGGRGGRREEIGVDATVLVRYEV
jgi:hypothetical protein